MRTLEYNHNGDWRDKLLNSWPFLVDSEQIKTLFAFAYCKKGNKWVWMKHDNTSLFGNGTFFTRYTVTPLTPWVQLISAVLTFFIGWVALLPFLYGLCFHISWRETGNRRYLQAGFLHKLNGRIGLIFRIPKNDAKAAEGTNGPNYGQSNGWDCGTK